MTLPTDPPASLRLPRLFASFDELLDLEPAERQLRLSAIEERDPAAAGELRAMLEADHPEAELEIERRFGASSGTAGSFAESAPLTPGTVIGPYEVVRALGRGGMGEVYLAIRGRDGFNQQVALKLLRAELGGAQAVERFHRECRIQARLAHPAIVPLIDVGVAPDGRPFLALQYIEGEPITTYADRQRLSLAARIRLVVACCRAVEAAHARLVVHRDIKPSNILVDAEGAVRLLDFGIAKVLGEPEEGDEIDLTRQAPAPMTPNRAAPEQLRGEAASTATDVWGLGVLLYELATGRLPFERRGRTPREIEREIREQGLTRPSRALPQGNDKPARSAIEALVRARSTTARRLGRELSGDFEVVTTRALAVEPERRYASAAAFADDLERLLEGRPVAARPDSLGYRMQRFAGRHRVGVTATSVAAIGLAVLSVATLFQSMRVARERDRASALEKQSTAVVGLLSELFSATSPNTGAGVGDISITDLLSRGAERVEAMSDSPAVRQRMFATLGRIRIERSELAEGKALFARARDIARAAGVDPLDPDRLALELAYTEALERMDDHGAAQALLRPLIAKLEAAGAERRPELAEALGQLALAVPPGQDGRALAERALALRRGLDPPRPIEVAASLDALGNLEFRRRDLRSAREAWREAEKILRREAGENDLRTLTVLNNLTQATEDSAEKLALMRRLIGVHRRLLGPNAGPVANGWNNIGVTLAILGDYPQAEKALRESHRLRSIVLGPDHTESVRTLRNVARVVELRGRYGEALAIFDEVLARLPASGIARELWPTFSAQRAMVLWRSGEQEAGRAEATRALAELRAHLPRSHDEIATALLLAARMAASGSEAKTAAEYSREALAIRGELLEPASAKIAEARAELGRALILSGDSGQGKPLLDEALSRLKGWGMLHPGDRAALEAALSGTARRPGG